MLSLLILNEEMEDTKMTTDEMKAEWLKNNEITVCDSDTEETCKNRDTITINWNGTLNKRRKTNKQRIYDAKTLSKNTNKK